MATRSSYLGMNPFDFHKHLINSYVLTRKGATKFLQRDTSRDKKDSDVIRENHRFLWDDDDEPATWEDRLAKKYYDKLFKEFCITDLTRYKENMFAMRWQTEQELVVGKGQFICGNKHCSKDEGLRTWEVNFAYKEQGEKKNALVKLRLCEKCSAKLNHRHKRKEIKRLKKPEAPRPGASSSLSSPRDDVGTRTGVEDGDGKMENAEEEKEEEIWNKPVEIDEPSREEEFEKYLEHLLL
ncbi:Hypothetical protein NTJ_14569 [Nesidiocoris tenuis]|uniref:Protein FRA10AC1 homolog n=1 Tax=Nesidiocoris tenuis TaxID=355587 RepID=A0ABN7BFY3_9HEMI|nr:Hypothetical protein NTJ_14569 [Nesidiocoris tenuis]